MEGLKNYREKIKSIEELVDKMESGELSIHELVKLVTLTGELHERSIILKYKAFENKFEDSNSDEDELEEADAQHQDVGTESDPIEDGILVEAELEKEEASAMDFSMFGEPEVEETKKEESRSLFELNLTQNDSIQEEPKVEQPKVEPTPEPIIEKKTEPVVEPIAESKPEPVAEESNAQHQDLGTESDPVIEKEEAITEVPNVVVKERGSSFLDRLTITDDSISSQLAGRKLDTLTGAFGINQRLLYINELFDGSGEAFSDAVKTLDTQSDLDSASAKVEEMAFQNSWNPEEEVVLEFLAIIKRRYA